jgi:hypothetical protein
VRLHFKPVTGMDASLEGVMMSRWAGVYVLQLPTLIEGENATVSLEDKVVVPKANVLFWETVPS